MKRMLLTSIPEVGVRVRPDSGESHHLLKVRRAKAGEILEVMDGKGGLARAQLLVEGREVALRIVERLEEVRESPLCLTLGLAIPSQASVFDTALPGLVQLGVNRIMLAPTDFGGRLKKGGDRYAERLHTICVQSLKQCGRTRIPEILFLSDWATLCQEMMGGNDGVVLFHPMKERVELKAKPVNLGMLIGPEGGFSPEEVDHARSQGIEIQGLGPRILKMETAMVGACFWAQRAYGDLW